jgi:hypothetical protein
MVYRDLKKKYNKLGACLQSYLSGRWRWEDHHLRPAQAEKVIENSISTNKPGVVVYVCNPST